MRITLFQKLNVDCDRTSLSLRITALSYPTTLRHLKIAKLCKSYDELHSFISSYPKLQTINEHNVHDIHTSTFEIQDSSDESENEGEDVEEDQDEELD